MDEPKKQDYLLPLEWVERLFTRMTEIFGERWTSHFKNEHYEAMAKTQWRGGLAGLSNAEIRYGLNICLNQLHIPPTVVEFYHYAKKYRVAPPPKPEITKASKATFDKHMALIRSKLHGRATPPQSPNTSEGNHPVPANDKQVLADSTIPEWLNG